MLYTPSICTIKEKQQQNRKRARTCVRTAEAIDSGVRCLLARRIWPNHVDICRVDGRGEELQQHLVRLDGLQRLLAQPEQGAAAVASA